jgi:hypothetical protein
MLSPDHTTRLQLIRERQDALVREAQLDAIARQARAEPGLPPARRRRLHLLRRLRLAGRRRTPIASSDAG